MYLMMSAILSAACIHGFDAGQILDAFQNATGPAGDSRYQSAVYSYQGQGLVGTVSTIIDMQDGRYVEDTDAGPDKEAAGYDGHLAWERDISGFVSVEDGGDKPALARSKAYRNANLWWARARGGATVEVVACEMLRITPLGGKPFDATFSPVTHLLNSVREDQSFGVFTTWKYSAYERRDGRLVPTRISIVTNDDPASRETLHLISMNFDDSISSAAFQMRPVATSDWSLPSAGRVTVPIRLVNNHVVTDVRINGLGPFPFLVDTGGHDIVTPATLRRIGLRSEGESPSFGAGDKAGSSGYSHVETIDAGGAVLHDQPVLILDFSPREVEGIQLGGMLGVEFIERFVVRIDYGAKTMTLIDPRRFAESERMHSGTAVPFTLYGHMPQVSGMFDGRPVRLDIDTGSRAGVTMTSPFVERTGLLQAYPDGVAITDGWGVGGASHSYVVRIGSLSLGSVAVPNVVAGLSAASVGAFADNGSEGNVGSGLLKRFTVTFDYANRTLYLNRLAAPDADTGRFDRIGMWLNMASSGLRVMDVAKGGPAAEAGLRVGDTITHLAGRSVSGRALSDVRKELTMVAMGTPFPVTYSRLGRRTSVIVIPRNLIPDVADAGHTH